MTFITNDANLWATENMRNPKYTLELILRVVTEGLIGRGMKNCRVLNVEFGFLMER